MIYETNLDSKDLKPYKGFQIEASWETTMTGKRIPGTTRYMVYDENDDWWGDCYKTLKEARACVDEIIEKGWK